MTEGLQLYDFTVQTIAELHELRGTVWIKVGEMDISDYGPREEQEFVSLQNYMNRVVIKSRRVRDE